MHGSIQAMTGVIDSCQMTELGEMPACTGQSRHCYCSFESHFNEKAIKAATFVSSVKENLSIICRNWRSFTSSQEKPPPCRG